MEGISNMWVYLMGALLSGSLISVSGRSVSPGACQGRNMDVTQANGVFLEKHIKSQALIEGLQFPAKTSHGRDRFTVEFSTTDLNGLIFHAQSSGEQQEMTAWVSEGFLSFRLRAQCGWYVFSSKIDDEDTEGKFVSDGEFHRIQVTVRKEVEVSVDNGEPQTFSFTKTRNYRRGCWKVDSISFGSPNILFTKSNHRYLRRRYPEYYERMNLCVRQFSTEVEDVSTKVAKYHRVSSCS